MVYQPSISMIMYNPSSVKPMNLPSITLDTGVFSATTCSHPPGAAQRSITTLAL